MKQERKIILTRQDIESLLSIRSILQEDPGQHTSIAALAAKTGMNRFKLTSGFKKFFNQSIHQYQIMLRMELAQRLLLTSDKPMKEIASICGYNRTENFSHAFKKYYGRVPSSVKSS